MIDRIKKIMEVYCQGNMSKFARSLGVTPAVVSNSIARGSFSVDLILRIVNAYPTISAEWLMRDEGDMMRDSFFQTGEVDDLRAQVSTLNKQIDDMRKDKELLYEHIELLRGHEKETDKA